MKIFNRLKVLLFILAWGSLVTACQKKDNGFQKPSYYEVKAEQSTIKFDAPGKPLTPGSDEIILKLFPAKTAVDLSASEEWCHLTLEPVTDSTAILKISVESNQGTARDCKIRAMAGKGAEMQGAIINVSQESALIIDPNAITASSDRKSYSVIIRSINPWTASVSEDWCSVDIQSGPAGNTAIVVTVSRNNKTDERSANIVFTSGSLSATLAVSQRAGVPIDSDIRMVLVKAGSFTMGATPEQPGPAANEKPTHQVILTKDFYISEFIVTQKQWELVMGNNPSQFTGDKNPVDHVSYNDVQEFISKLNDATGKNYRLPTEAEWEFAARGGNESRNYIYAGSNTVNDVAWYGSNSDNVTHEVGTKLPNELGLYDMSGNVYEWVSDWFDSYAAEPAIDPKGPATGTKHTLRGGSYRNGASNVRVSKRASEPPTTSSDNISFRLAMDK